MKLINGMEPERYLASLLLANSSYKGEKYYEKEDEYTEIIKENKYLLLDNNKDGLMEQIEKMAKERSEIKDIMKLLDKCVSLNPMCKSEVASVLYGNNYRKISEDSVVLSMEEYKKLKGSYKGEKYYDEEDAFIWRVSYGEYELSEDGGIILDSTAASVFSVGELVKVVFEDEEDQIGIYRVVKVTDTQCVCEFIK